jgi:hypothetical protein
MVDSKAQVLQKSSIFFKNTLKDKINILLDSFICLIYLDFTENKRQKKLTI